MVIIFVSLETAFVFVMAVAALFASVPVVADVDVGIDVVVVAIGMAAIVTDGILQLYKFRIAFQIDELNG